MFPIQNYTTKDAPWIWTKDQGKAVTRVNQEMKKVAELTHFKRNKPLRIICDASKQEGLYHRITFQNVLKYIFVGIFWENLISNK